MAYDEALAERLRAVVAGEPGLTEQRMFGGLAFLINGNMAVAASGQGGLLLRVDPARTESLLSPPQVRRFEMRGREMDGWLRVDGQAVESEDELRRWVAHGVGYASSLPDKQRRYSAAAPPSTSSIGSGARASSRSPRLNRL